VAMPSFVWCCLDYQIVAYPINNRCKRDSRTGLSDRYDQNHRSSVGKSSQAWIAIKLAGIGIYSVPTVMGLRYSTWWLIVRLDGSSSLGYWVALVW